MAIVVRLTMVIAAAAIAIHSNILELAAQEDKKTQEERPRFKRRDQSSDEDLRKQLHLIPEVGFDQAGASYVLTYLQKLAQSQPLGKPVATPPPDVGLRFYTQFSQQLKRPDLISLPWRSLAESQLGKESAEGLHVYSVNLRT